MKLLINYILKKNPKLINDLLAANIKKEPIVFVKESINKSLLFSSMIFVFLFFISLRVGNGFFSIVILSIILFFILLGFFLKYPRSVAMKRGKLIDKDVLFLGRYIETKLISGESLINTIYLSTNNYGEASKVMKEISYLINMGVMIEDAVKHVRDSVPSQKMKLILNQIIEALETGTDITETLNKVLNRLMKEQEIAIKEYGRKLNSFAMMYLMTCIVLPALGFAIFSIAASFVGITLNSTLIFFILIFFIFIQLIFVNMFKTIKPISLI